MSGTMGTYADGYRAWTPFNVLPEPDDYITWDWMDAVSQLTQRYRTIVQTVGTVGAGAGTIFDYSSLKCDVHPPILQFYIYNPASATWRQFVEGAGDGGGYQHGAQFYQIGLGTAKLWNYSTVLHPFKMIAYL